jgi:hypothetical protein
MSNKKSSTTVIFNSINVNAIDDISGIFVGDNIQWNWSQSYKENFGLGSIIGTYNFVYRPLNIVNDPDVVDYPVNQTLISRESMNK